MCVECLVNVLFTCFTIVSKPTGVAVALISGIERTLRVHTSAVSRAVWVGDAFVFKQNDNTISNCKLRQHTWIKTETYASHNHHLGLSRVNGDLNLCYGQNGDTVKDHSVLTATNLCFDIRRPSTDSHNRTSHLVVFRDQSISGWRSNLRHKTNTVYCVTPSYRKTQSSVGQTQ